MFFKAGISTFGGGPAIIAVLESECVGRCSFLSTDEFVEDVALATAVPGAICVNLAFLSGYRMKGLCGSAVAAGGVILAPFLAITVILTWFGHIMENPLFTEFLQGAGAAVTGLIVVSAWSVGKSLLKESYQYLGTIAFVGLVGGRILSPLAGVIGVLVVNLLIQRNDASDSEEEVGNAQPD